MYWNYKLIVGTLGMQLREPIRTHFDLSTANAINKILSYD